MIIIVGAINNPLFIPAAGANPQTGETALPLLDGQTAFALLFQNAENGLDDITGEGEKTVLCEPADASGRKDEKQPNLDLFGLAAANSLMYSQTENPVPAAKADSTSIVSVGAPDSQAGGMPTAPLNQAFVREKLPLSEVSAQAEPEQAQGLRTGFKTAHKTVTEPVKNHAVPHPEKTADNPAQADSVIPNSFGKGEAKVDFAANAQPKQRSEVQSEPQAVPKVFVTQNGGTVNQQTQTNPEAKAEPVKSAEIADGTITVVSENAAADVPAQTSSTKNLFLFEKVSTEEIAADAQVSQDDAFQSNLKAIRTELDARTGFRQNGAVQRTAESVYADTLSTPAGKETRSVAFENTAAEQTKPQDVKDADRLEPKNKFGQSAGVQKAAGGESEPEFKIPFKEKASPVEERFSNINAAAAQSNAQVHRTAAAKVREAQPQTDIVTQLEAPIKKEALKGVNTSFKIKLKPEGLGEVTVDLTHVSGKLEVSIRTELSSTKELISESIHTLRNALTADKGPNALTLGSLTVEQDGRQFGAFSQSGLGGDRHGFSGFSRNAFGFQETDKQKTYSTARYKTGLIDYTV